MESFRVATNAVIPFLFYLTYGYAARRFGVVDEVLLGRMNKMAFRLFYPFMAFYNIYKADPDGMPTLKLLIVLAAGVLGVQALMLLIVPRFIKGNPQRGVVIQGMFRSNFILMGLSLMASVYGDAGNGIVAMVVVVVVSIYNVTSALILQYYAEDGKANLKDIVMGLVTNPILQGTAVGLVFFIGKIRLPEGLMTPISALANLTTPLALLILGGTLRFGAIYGNRKPIIATVFVKLVALPLVMVIIGYAIGLRQMELFCLVTVFASPVATASYPMAQNMGGDGELAGQLVVISTVLSVGTLFVWLFAMQSIGLL